MNKKLLGISLAGWLGWSWLAGIPAARAQSVELTMDIFTSTVLSQTTTLLNNNAVMAASRNAEAERRGGRAANTAHVVSLAYTPTPALRQQTVQTLARQLSARNAAAGQAVTTAFGPGKTDYNQLFSQMVKESGLPANNAATAFAAYLEIAYVVVSGTPESSVTPAMDRAVQRQATGILAQNKALTTPDAVAKAGEELKLQAVLLYLGWQSAKQNGQEAQFRSSIASTFRSKGLDLSLVKLTLQGLVKK
jgi:hypothetical protein